MAKKQKLERWLALYESMEPQEQRAAEVIMRMNLRKLDAARRAVKTEKTKIKKVDIAGTPSSASTARIG